jgi:heme-degrading monooxygenase HmoA
MIERHVTFDILEDKSAQFVSFLREKYLPSMSVQSGFRGVEILRPLETSNRFTLVIKFDTLESSANWRSSKAHKELTPVLKSFYSGSSALVYESIPLVP